MFLRLKVLPGLLEVIGDIFHFGQRLLDVPPQWSHPRHILFQTKLMGCLLVRDDGDVRRVAKHIKEREVEHHRGLITTKPRPPNTAQHNLTQHSSPHLDFSHPN